uniref:Transmembrane protein n=1 Tax=Heterorhabditis bacteriophora TaxID=37862 RepID=A0A1I7XDT1_HETBA
MAVSFAWRSTRLVVQIVPIVVLIIVFIALVGYVSWSLHIFNPTPPLIHIDCNFMYGKDGKQRLANYLTNRTVILSPEPSSTKYLIAWRSTIAYTSFVLLARLRLAVQTGDREKSLAIDRCISEHFDDSGNCVLGMENHHFAMSV